MAERENRYLLRSAVTFPPEKARFFQHKHFFPRVKIRQNEKTEEKEISASLVYTLKTALLVSGAAAAAKRKPVEEGKGDPASKQGRTTASSIQWKKVKEEEEKRLPWVSSARNSRLESDCVSFASVCPLE